VRCVACVNNSFHTNPSLPFLVACTCLFGVVVGAAVGTSSATASRILGAIESGCFIYLCSSLPTTHCSITNRLPKTAPSLPTSPPTGCSLHRASGHILQASGSAHPHVQRHAPPPPFLLVSPCFCISHSNSQPLTSRPPSVGWISMLCLTFVEESMGGSHDSH